MNDPEKKLRCPSCGAWMSRDFSGIAIGGDLPSRWDHYDEGLGAHVYGKAHRNALMKARGLEEYSPDPSMEAIRQERRYIRKETKGANRREMAEAGEAMHKLNHKAGKLRRERIVRAELKKLPKPGRI